VDDEEEEEDYPPEPPAMDKKPPFQQARASDASSVGEKRLREWMPLYEISEYQDEELHDMCTVVVDLPSGSGQKGYFKAAVCSDTNKQLEVSVRWGKLMLDPEKMHKRQKTESNSNLVDRKIMGFKKYHSTLRKSPTDEVWSTTRIELPFPAENRIEENNPLGDKEGARLLYVTLRSSDKGSYEAHAEKEFDIVDEDE
jgi:hypothetical protein